MIDDQLMRLKGGISALDILPDRDAASLIVHGGGSPRLRTSVELARAVEARPGPEARQWSGVLATRFRELTGNALKLYKDGKISIEPNPNTAPFLRDLITQLDVSEDDLFPLDGAKSLRLYGRDAPHVVLSGDLVSRMRRHAEIHNVDVNTVGFCLFAFVRSILDMTLRDEKEAGLAESKALAKVAGAVVPMGKLQSDRVAVEVPFVLAQLGATPEDIFPPEDELIRLTALRALDGWQYRVTETLLAQLSAAALRLDRSELELAVNLVGDVIRLVDGLMAHSNDPLLGRLEVKGRALFPSVHEDVEILKLDGYMPIAERLYKAIVACAEDNGCDEVEIGYNMLESLRGLLADHLAAENYYMKDSIPFDYELGSQLVGRGVTKQYRRANDDPVPVGSLGTVIKLLPRKEGTGFAIEVFWDHKNHWVFDDVIELMRFCTLDDEVCGPYRWNLQTNGYPQEEWGEK